jgi:hypothetical protein
MKTKTILWLFTVSLCLASTEAMARILRVNNGTGVTNTFTTIQAAHNAANAGDTIHIEPGLNSYGDLDMTKRLVILHTGAFSTSNPGLQADPKHGNVGKVIIRNGASGSVVSVRFDNGIYLENANNVVLRHCVGSSGILDNANCCSRSHIQVTNSDNVVVSKCIVTRVSFGSNSNNFICSNNIIWGLASNDGSSDGVVTNNVIRAGFPNDASSFANCVVANNIFNTALNYSFSNCNLSNNFAPGIGTAPDGFTFVDMATVFVANTGAYVDNRFQPKPGSPAFGAGQGGVDCGAFGGADPYRLGATPPIPSIYKLTVPAAPGGNTMNVTFSTRSNN